MSRGATMTVLEAASRNAQTPTSKGQKRKLGGTSSSALTGLHLMSAATGKARDTAGGAGAAAAPLSPRDNSATAATPPTAPEESPADFVTRVFCQHGVDPANMSVPWVKPTEEMIAAYCNETLKAARAGNVDQLRQMLQSGKSLDCCNRFGESLIHLACRRGNLDLVRFLILDAKVTLLVRDDYGRSILHDAFWTPQPQLDLVDFLLEHVPDLLCVRDVRGHAPVDYVRQEHKASWLDFLRQRQHKLCPKHAAPSSSCTESTSAS